MKPSLSPTSLWGLSCHPEPYEAFPVTQNLMRHFLSPRTLWGLSYYPEPYKAFPVTQNFKRPFLWHRTFWDLSCHTENYEAFPFSQKLMKPFLSPRILWGLFHNLNSNKKEMACEFIDDLEIGEERNAVLVISSRNFLPLIETNLHKDVHNY